MLAFALNDGTSLRGALLGLVFKEAYMWQSRQKPPSLERHNPRVLDYGVLLFTQPNGGVGGASCGHMMDADDGGGEFPNTPPTSPSFDGMEEAPTAEKRPRVEEEDLADDNRVLPNGNEVAHNEPSAQRPTPEKRPCVDEDNNNNNNVIDDRVLPNGTEVVLTCGGEPFCRTRVIEWEGRNYLLRIDVEKKTREAGKQFIEKDFTTVFQFGGKINGKRIKAALASPKLQQLVDQTGLKNLQDYTDDAVVAALKDNKCFHDDCLKKWDNDICEQVDKAFGIPIKKTQKGTAKKTTQGTLVVMNKQTLKGEEKPLRVEDVNYDMHQQWVTEAKTLPVYKAVAALAGNLRRRGIMEPKVDAFFKQVAKKKASKERFFYWMNRPDLVEVVQKPWFFGLLDDADIQELHHDLRKRSLPCKLFFVPLFFCFDFIKCHSDR